MRRRKMKNNNDAYGNAINEAKRLMYSQTTKNGAPSWLLTTLAVNVGKELALEYNVDKNIVVLTLYLQHLVFDPVTNGEVQKNHPELSASFVENGKLLEKWNIPDSDRGIILKAIRSHHNKEKSDNLIVEVIKNAECQKFITIEGVLIWLHELGLRGYSFEDAKKLVFYKMEQKKSLLTLDKCINKGNADCKSIIKMFDDGSKLMELKKLHKYGVEKIKYEDAIKNINLHMLLVV